MIRMKKKGGSLQSSSHNSEGNCFSRRAVQLQAKIQCVFFQAQTTGNYKSLAWKASWGKAALHTPDLVHSLCTAISGGSCCQGFSAPDLSPPSTLPVATLTCTSAFLAQVPPFRALFISLTGVGKTLTETLSSTRSVFPLLSLLLGPWNSRSLLCQARRQWDASSHLCGMSLTELCLVPFPGENGTLRRQPFAFWPLAYTTAVSEWSLDCSFQFGLLPNWPPLACQLNTRVMGFWFCFLLTK